MIAGTPPTWRLLRALSLLRRWFPAQAENPRGRRASLARAQLLNRYMLEDIGLARVQEGWGSERSSFGRLMVLKEDKEGHL